MRDQTAATLPGVASAGVAARALGPGGAICARWNRPRDLAGPVWDAIHGAYAKHAPALDRRAALRQQPEKKAQIEPAPGFGPWTLRTYDWAATYDAESYSGVVGTHSDHLRLPAPQRARALSTPSAQPSPKRATADWNTATAPCCSAQRSPDRNRLIPEMSD